MTHTAPRNAELLTLGRLIAAAVCLLLPACASKPSRTAASPAPACCKQGGYYQNDGPGDNPPADLDTIADAQPRVETLNRFANKPYNALGHDYVPLTSLQPYREQGIASWYGRQFHHQRTADGEIYDMYGMTAAHPTLPLPSYARITSMATGKTTIVRVNDRGPFYPGRVIDLSYAAAYKLGIAQHGSGEVIVESLLPGNPLAMASAPSAVVPPTGQTPRSGEGLPGIPVAEEQSGVYLQMGAFANYANASNFLEHVQSQVVWLGETAHVSQRDGLYRVRMGPYANADEAHRVGSLVEQALAITPSVHAQ